MTAYARDYVPVSEQYTNIGVISCPNYCNIRLAPDVNSAVVGLIPNGGVCEIQKKSDKWFAIKSGDISGYIMSDYIDSGREALSKADELAYTTIKFNQLTPIYASKSTASKVWDKALTGSVYTVTEEDDGWITIDLEGATGYVQADSDVTGYMAMETATPSYDVSGVSKERASLVKCAMKFLGNKYLWGGEDPNNGIDCSAFVRYCYRETTDVRLPRVSYEQCYVGEKISSLEMLPGDLIFYADSTGTVGHVAMYIGNGTIIHAASKASGIKLSQWNYRTPKYIRRLLG
jgi:cell wall-associated NlpC family hydrolase